jgi:hypothetical protein
LAAAGRRHCGPVAGLVLSHPRFPRASPLSREFRPLLVTRSPWVSLSRLTFFLRNRLGAEITVHGVLVEIFGVGVLILGPSGIGKSESALELVTRGHRLIADDMVIVHRGESRSVMGSGPASPATTWRFIGIIDVKGIRGGGVAATAEIGSVVQLEEWNNGATTVSVSKSTTASVGIPVTDLRVPVSPGGTSPSSRSRRAQSPAKNRGITARTEPAPAPADAGVGHEVAGRQGGAPQRGAAIGNFVTGPLPASSAVKALEEWAPTASLTCRPNCCAVLELANRSTLS